MTPNQLMPRYSGSSRRVAVKQEAFKIRGLPTWLRIQIQMNDCDKHTFQENPYVTSTSQVASKQPMFKQQLDWPCSFVLISTMLSQQIYNLQCFFFFGVFPWELCQISLG